MSCTCLWSSGSTLMRRTSPWTRIIGGRPDDRCKSDALFLTENASSWVMSMRSGDGCVRWRFGRWARGLRDTRRIMATIAANIQQVRARIATACAAAQRPVQSVTLLAVSKTFGPEAVREAVAAGERRFGENYVQEAVDKMAALADLRDRIEWH